MKKKIAFKVLGCKVNTYEIQAIKQEFLKLNYDITDDIEEIADVYVINTCSVTNTSDKKSRQAIRKCIKQNPEAVVAVIGCYSQLKPEEVGSIEGVDIILGTQDRDKLVSYVEEFLEKRKPIIHVSDIMKQDKFESLNVSFYDGKTRGFLKIQEGCNNFCTFCIIPWARGLIRSQSPKDVLLQAESFVKNGIKEIVLTGIHTGGYGADFEDYTFVNLLEDLEEIPNLERIRISSIEITQLDEDFLEYLKKSKKIVDHLHVPIQSGDNDILIKMKRNYDLNFFYEKVSEIRKIKPDIAFSTDVIVGFPQESDLNFKNTCETIKELRINNLHVFPYSKREGTPAARMDGQVDESVKKKRVKELIEIGKELNHQYNKKFLNKTLQVLIENKDKEGYYTGYTPNYIKVKIKDDSIQSNKIYNVKLVKISDTEVIGKII